MYEPHLIHVNNETKKSWSYVWVKYSDDENNATKRSGHRRASKYSGHTASLPLPAGGYQLNSLLHQILELLQDTLSFQTKSTLVHINFKRIRIVLIFILFMPHIIESTQRKSKCFNFCLFLYSLRCEHHIILFCFSFVWSHIVTQSFLVQLKELKERQRQQNKQKAIKLGLDPEWVLIVCQTSLIEGSHRKF